MKQGGSTTATVLPVSQHEPALSIVDTSPHREEVDSELERAQEQLLALRRQQEELERQKGDLEDLRRKQDEYVRGKAEMVDRFTRSLLTLEHEQVEAQRMTELCSQTRIAFRDSLEQIQSIHDQEWNSTNLRAELSRALGIVENARAEFHRAQAKLDCLNHAHNGKEGDMAPMPARFDWEETIRYARIGAAASAPLIIAGTIWLIILLVAR